MAMGSPPRSRKACRFVTSLTTACRHTTQSHPHTTRDQLKRGQTKWAGWILIYLLPRPLVSDAYLEQAEAHNGDGGVAARGWQVDEERQEHQARQVTGTVALLRQVPTLHRHKTQASAGEA